MTSLIRQAIAEGSAVREGLVSESEKTSVSEYVPTLNQWIDV